jgi:hypothetical protein
MMKKTKAGGLIAISALGGVIVLASPASANMTIDVLYDSSVTSLENAAQFEGAFAGVVSQFESAITNPITVNIYVSVGTIEGTTVPLPSGDVSGDATTKTVMGSSAAASFANTAAILKSIGDAVPATDPTINAGGAGGEATFYMPQAEVKALGLPPTRYPTSAPYDGYIGFSSKMNEFSFSGAPGSNQYSFQAAAEHEIEEVLGRTSFLNNGGTLYESLATPMDLLRYIAAGVPSYTLDTPPGGTPAYASVDGGATDLGTFDGENDGFDRTDWETPVNTTSTDAQNAILTPGAIEGLSLSDEAVLEGLGYTIAAGDGDGLFNVANAPAGATQDVNAVAEPASVSLLVAGVGLLGLKRRRLRGLVPG